MPPVGTLEILVILIAVLLFGPKRIPEIARQIGSAMTELRKASDTVMTEITREANMRRDTSLPKPPSGKDAGGEPEAEPEPEPEAEPQPEPKLTREQLREAATKLGIEIKGKSDEQIRSEMLQRIYSNQPDPYGLSEGKAG